MLDEGSIPSISTKKVFMKAWVEYFPPLNLFNYNLFWKWQYEDASNENLSDGDDRFRQHEIEKTATR